MKLNLSFGKVLMRSSRSKSNCLKVASWAADSGVGIRDAMARWKRWILLTLIMRRLIIAKTFGGLSSFLRLLSQSTNTPTWYCSIFFQIDGIFVDHFRNFRTHFSAWFGIDMNRKPGNHFFKVGQWVMTLLKWFKKMLLERKMCSKIRSKLWCFKEKPQDVLAMFK